MILGIILLLLVIGEEITMARAGLTKDRIVRKAAELANEVGFDKITLKLLADSLHVQPPSLYNHIEGIEALQ